MRLFGRKKEEDLSKEIISDLKLQNDELSSKIEEILKSNRELEKEVYSLRKEHETLNQMRIDYSNLKTELGDLKTQLSDNYGEMVELTKSTTDVNKMLVSKIEEITSVKEIPKRKSLTPTQAAPEYTLDDKGVLYNSNGVSQIPIESLVMLKNNYKYKTYVELAMELGISEPHCRRIATAIKNGKYDDIFEKWESLNKNEPICNEKECEEENGNFHFVDVADSYKLYYKSLELKGLDVYSKNRIIISMEDLLSIKEDIPKINKSNVLEYARKYDIKIGKFNKIIWNIEEGEFDAVIDEYFQRTYSFSVNNVGYLCIDGEDTYLTREKCRVMIDTVINVPDKQKCIEGLCHTHSTIKPEHIRIVCNEYNNPNLIKILKGEVKSIPKIDNPQKRRENGYC